MKKLLLTSAIVAVAFSSSSFAEVKISGEIEQTWTSHSYEPTGSKVNGSNAIGSEANVKFTGEKELTNGAKVNAAIRAENQGSIFRVDQKELGITIGGFKAHVGIDTGSTIDGNMVVHVGQQSEDVMAGPTALLAKATHSKFSAHDKEHIGFSFKNDMGELALNYAPSNNTSNGPSSITDAGASATEIVFTGSLGVKGLAIKVGQQDTGSDNGSGSDEKEKFYGATYSIGKAKVGYSNRSFDREGTAVEIDNSNSYSVAYAVSDNLSVAVERLDTKEKGTANEEELTLIGVSYNLGGLGIEAYYGQAKDIGGASGADSDAVQLRTVFAY